MREFPFFGSRWDLSGFHQLFEFPKRFLDLGRGLFTEHG
jgi:hypothetical protein